jgi:hypothetical protein
MISRRQRRYQANEQDIQRAVVQHLAWCAHPDAFCPKNETVKPAGGGARSQGFDDSIPFAPEFR